MTQWRNTSKARTGLGDAEAADPQRDDRSRDLPQRFVARRSRTRACKTLLDGVVDYLPCPTDMSRQPRSIWNEDGREFASSAQGEGRCRCTGVQDHGRQIRLNHVQPYLCRYVEKVPTMLNSVTANERIGRMVQMHANSREDVKGAIAGDIVALAGLKKRSTGHTLCTKDDQPVEQMVFPEPVRISIRTERQRSTGKLSVALGKIVDRRSVLRCRNRHRKWRDHSQRNGRAAPRYQDRHSQPHL